MRFSCASLAGGLAGFVNGLFGGGGGMVLVPLLLSREHLPPKDAFATSIAVILPICAASFLFQLPGADFSLREALPYLAGGTLGGLLGGRLFRELPPQWLRRLFALFLLYGAWRYLLC